MCVASISLHGMPGACLHCAPPLTSVPLDHSFALCLQIRGMVGEMVGFAMQTALAKNLEMSFRAQALQVVETFAAFKPKVHSPRSSRPMSAPILCPLPVARDLLVSGSPPQSEPSSCEPFTVRRPPTPAAANEARRRARLGPGHMRPGVRGGGRGGARGGRAER